LALHIGRRPHGLATGPTDTTHRMTTPHRPEHRMGEAEEAPPDEPDVLRLRECGLDNLVLEWGPWRDMVDPEPDSPRSAARAEGVWTGAMFSWSSSLL
jgi:hypothetical protein